MDEPVRDHVHPASAAPEADYQLRIFTPGGELPFAGHPTLGSARAWLDNGGAPSTPAVSSRSAAPAWSACATAGAACPSPPRRLSATARSRKSTSARSPPRSASAGTVSSAHQWVDNGPGWAVVQLPTAKEVLALEPDLSLIPDAMVGAIGAYPDGSGHAFEMRTFAPRVGVAEDPVCGSMNASVGQWLTATGAAPRHLPGLPGHAPGPGRNRRDHRRCGRHRLGRRRRHRLHPRHHHPVTRPVPRSTTNHSTRRFWVKGDDGRLGRVP